MSDTERDAFEAWISGPPYECDVSRYTSESAWPGNYRSLPVDLAWCSWQARAALAVPVGAGDGDGVETGEPCQYPACGCPIRAADGLPDCRGAAEALKHAAGVPDTDGRQE